MSLADANKGAAPKRRGRPAILPPGWRSIARELAPDATSPKGAADVWYRTRALHLLAGDPALTWLVDSVENLKAGGGHWRPGILSALGRIEDEAQMRALAVELCEMKPNTKTAIALLRIVRTRRGVPGDAMQLADAILRTIRHYGGRHAGVTRALISEALTHCLDVEREPEL